MVRIPLLVLPIFVLLISFPVSNSIEVSVRQSLVQFMQKLSSGNRQNDQNWGWNMTSDPCNDNWVGVSCDSQFQTVTKIVLDDFNFTGYFDASSLCMLNSLVVLSLTRNNVGGSVPAEIGNCEGLTHLYLRHNRFSGPIPETLSQLSNLKRLDISNNYFSGEISGLSRISGLVSLLAQENQLSGVIPDLDFSNLQEFNISHNNFTGRIPDIPRRFSADNFIGNPGLCGKPLNECPALAAPAPSPVAEAPESFKNKIKLIIFAFAIIAIS
ncbi:probable inactive receptor kinase At2g26730 [Ricinus communis]|uniref:Serine-threonine protein kinase, plant-type, putative n=1 Tax=Ricinus communis TaxID=3988 RepID=B9RXI1_RICCO|nr:probable inactive receptor kinase At2g26730 [Ricinus communis]EEF43837.1 serine-threonine protein kinase, plant-type, putative [Ricinus communis]|eukprot:XP_002518450.1 probable inactive receptor kinase At2g26730 [Ricinus communis]